MCSLRLQFADLFPDLPLAHKITVNQTGAFYFSQICSEDVFNFSRKKLMKKEKKERKNYASSKSSSHQ